MKTKALLIIMSLVLIVPNFIKKDIIGEPAYNYKERFNPDLSVINSVDMLEAYVDDSAAVARVNIYSEKYIALLAYVVSCRFYHGFSHFKLSENWIAAVAEKCFGYGMASKVETSEILKHPFAACSQQALVMMEILRRKNINYRKVGFPHHYALEVMINKKWYFFDPNMEPDISLAERLHENWKGYNDSLKQYYSTAQHSKLDFQFGTGKKAVFGRMNEIPAQKATLFQRFTAIVSKLLWCMPLIILVALKRRRFKMHAVKPVNHFPRGQNLTPVFSA